VTPNNTLRVTIKIGHKTKNFSIRTIPVYEFRENKIFNNNIRRKIESQLHTAERMSLEVDKKIR
jgi:hypothetical protein